MGSFKTYQAPLLAFSCLQIVYRKGDSEGEPGEDTTKILKGDTD